MSFITSTNMSLPIPSVGNEPGPDYAYDINNCLTLIDSHDHTPGRGAPITPAAFNINGDLTFNGYSAINLASTVYTPLSTASVTPNSISIAPGGESPPQDDLWFTPNTGLPIQITKNGIVNVVASSIPGESYAAGTFFWTQTQDGFANRPANFDIGSVTIRPNVDLTTNGVTLTPNAGISSQYNLVLPLLPVANAFVALDQSGNLTAPIAFSKGITASNIANNTITGSLLVNNTITSTQIANGTITTTQINAAAGIIPSQTDSLTSGDYYKKSASNSGSFSTTSTSFVNVTNLVNIGPNIIVTSRPVFINFTGGACGILAGVATDMTVTFQIIRNDSTVISTYTLREVGFASSSTSIINFPCGFLNCIDPAPNASNNTYTLQVKTVTSASPLGSAQVINVSMQVFQV